MRFSRVLLSGLLLWLWLAGCNGAEVRIGFAGTTLDGRMAYTYETFTGTESSDFQAEAGRTFSLVYDVTINKGRLTIYVREPDGGTLWESSLTRTAKAGANLTLTGTGRYTVTANGENTGGGFDISWTLS